MTVTQIRQDAMPGFDEFVAAEGEGLLRLAYLLTTSAVPAVAVLEDALARTYGAWPRLSAAGHPQDYARRALVHEATEGHRLRRNHPPRYIDLDAGTDSDVTTDLDSDLVRALRALPADERAATVLRHCLELSEMETADALGCTVGAVRRQTMRAQSRLTILLPAAPTARASAHSLVELMRHMQASLRALPDRLDMRLAPDLVRNVKKTHARRTLRRRTTVFAVAASALVILTVLVLQLTGRSSTTESPAAGSRTQTSASVLQVPLSR